MRHPNVEDVQSLLVSVSGPADQRGLLHQNSAAAVWKVRGPHVVVPAGTLHFLVP
jgi:hypothetical protein